VGVLHLSIPPELTAHVAVALEHHLRRCREQGTPVPDGLIDLRDWAVVVRRGLSSEEPPMPSDTGGMNDTLLLSLPQAAKVLDCSVTTVKRLVREGALQVVRLGPTGRQRIRHADLIAFVEDLDGGTFRDRVRTKDSSAPVDRPVLSVPSTGASSGAGTTAGPAPEAHSKEET
jgi:excisionase family DNA binding protein